MVRAVQANTTHEQRWIVLYVRRWLAAPIVMPDGRTQARDKGTPQGSAVSPVIANLFMHYAFDIWLEREFPAVKFERYADDAVVHCATERQANEVLAALEKRMAEVGLQLHPDKTRIVFCKDGRRRYSDCEHTSFTFLGYTFRARNAPTRDGTSMFTGFLPAVSKDALKRMSEEVRSWRIHLRTATELKDLASWRRYSDCEHTSFTFLGYTFRARNAPTRDGTSMFTGFLPAVSKDALKRMSEEVRSRRAWSSASQRFVTGSDQAAADIRHVVRVRGVRNDHPPRGAGKADVEAVGGRDIRGAEPVFHAAVVPADGVILALLPGKCRDTDGLDGQRREARLFPGRVDGRQQAGELVVQLALRLGGALASGLEVR